MFSSLAPSLAPPSSFKLLGFYLIAALLARILICTLHLVITCLDGGFQICFLFLTDIGFLNLHPNPINQLAIGYHCRDRGLKPPHPPFHIIIALRYSIDMWATLMMHQRPVQRNHFAPT